MIGARASWVASAAGILALATAFAMGARAGGTSEPAAGGTFAKAVPAGGLSTVDLRRAYDVTPLLERGFDGRGQTVIFMETAPPNPRDLATYAQNQALPPISTTVIGNAGSGDSDEADMDVEVVHALAPRASLMIDYVGADPAHWFDAMPAIAAAFPGAIVSASLGICEPLLYADSKTAAGAAEQNVVQAQSRGVKFFVSSGDNAAFDCLAAVPELPTQDLISVSWPCSMPEITCTGGTRLSVKTDGGYYRETVWEDPLETEGAGGGVSLLYDRPPWQAAPAFSALSGDNSRLTPDVAADADPVSGARILTGGKWGQGGGTSQSAPIWAGIIADIAEYAASKHQSLPGLLNPPLYQLAEQDPAALHDITVGTNLDYQALPGFDLASGWGTPDAWALAQALTGAGS